MGRLVRASPPLVWSLSQRACPMPYPSRTPLVFQDRSTPRDTATERWLKTIRQKVENTPTQPRVHFQRSPLRPVDEEGTLRDFE